MWFKNLRLYRLSQPFSLSAEELDPLLQQRAFRPCGSHEPSSLGWSAPLGRGREALAHELSDCLMVCVRQEDRLLPPAVISEALEEKLQALEEGEGRRPGRRERNELRDEIIQQLLPRAFARSLKTYAMIDRQQGWILVDAVSANKAEILIGLLRETLGSLPVRSFEVNQAPAAVFTGWLEQPERYPDFELLDSCELRDPAEDGGVIRCKGLDLAGEEIRGHLAAGMQAVKLMVAWDERIACSLEADLALKRVKFLDLIQEQATDVQTEDEVARFDVEFSLMCLEFRRLIPRLLSLFGGMANN